MPRIAHITDLHLGPMPKPLWRHLTSTKALTGLANWYHTRNEPSRFIAHKKMLPAISCEKPDAIVVTGDIVNIGSKLEIESVRHFLNSLARIAPLALTAGNHDAYQPRSMRWMDAYWSGYVATYGSRFSLAFPYIVELGNDWVMLCLNSGIATPLFHDHGSLGQAQLAKARSMAANQRAQGRRLIVALHHPPIFGKIRKLPALVEAQSLLQLIDDFSVEVLLHGHDHRFQIKSYGQNNTTIVCGPMPQAYRKGDVSALFGILDLAANMEARPSSYALFGFNADGNIQQLARELLIYRSDAGENATRTCPNITRRG